MEKKEILNNFLISKSQENAFKEYLERLQNYNSHTNIVGKSTLINPWISHILDSLQILPFIQNKKSLFILCFIIYAFGWNPKTTLTGDVASFPTLNDMNTSTGTDLTVTNGTVAEYISDVP